MRVWANKCAQAVSDQVNAHNLRHREWEEEREREYYTPTHPYKKWCRFGPTQLCIIFSVYDVMRFGLLSASNFNWKKHLKFVFTGFIRPPRPILSSQSVNLRSLLYTCNKILIIYSSHFFSRSVKNWKHSLNNVPTKFAPNNGPLEWCIFSISLFFPLEEFQFFFFRCFLAIAHDRYN